MTVYPLNDPANTGLLELSLYLIQQEQQQSGHVANVVLIADIDNFVVQTASREAGYMQAVREQVLQALQRTLEALLPGTLIVPFDLDAYAILLSLPGSAAVETTTLNPAEAQAVALAERLVENTRLETSVTVALGVSQYHPERGGILAAFQEAQAAVRHKLVLGGNRVLFIRDLGPNQSATSTVLPVLGPEHPLWAKVRRGDSADLSVLLRRWVQQSVGSGQPTLAAIDNVVADTLLYSLRVVAESGTSPLYNYAVNRLLQELKLLSTIHEQSYLVFRLENYFRELVALVASNDTAAHDAVTRARQIIHERFATDLSLGSVAKEVYVSLFHLSHLFRHMLGTTFLEYLTEYRLQQARVYLEETRDTIAAVAVRVGYADSRYFSQLFKKRLGLTPSEYRQRLLLRL